MKRLERLLQVRRRREEAAARSVAQGMADLAKVQNRMDQLLSQRTQPVVDARRMAAFRMTGAWTADELEQVSQLMVTSATDLDEARRDLHRLRTEREIVEEHVERGRAAAALISTRVAQNAADELALLRALAHRRTRGTE